LQGSVYQLALSDVDDGNPHPHVVVITFSGNRDCIVVPAYSVDGFKINEYIGLARQDGLEDDQIFVQLDNAQYIDFTCHFPAKEAFWCTARYRRLSQHAVQQGKRIGQMKPAGMHEIAKRLIALAETDPRGLSRNAVKALRNLVKVLELDPAS
jgi:hypothetical protein